MVVKIARMSGGVGEMEESLIQYSREKRKKKNGMSGYRNLVLFLAAVYVALFIGSIAKYVLLFVLFAIYFFARLD